MKREFLDFNRNAFDESLEVFGSYVYYDNVKYLAVVNALELSAELQDGGFLEELGTTVLLRKCDLQSAPLAGKKVTIDGKAVRIQKVDSDEISYSLRCETAKK